MTVKELKEILSKVNDDAQIIVGCQGYLSEYNFDEDIRITENGNALYITDNCYYKETQK